MNVGNQSDADPRTAAITNGMPMLNGDVTEAYDSP